MSSCLCLGIEDTFRTAATEVSLLTGSEEFNATKLFEVGKSLSLFFNPNIGSVLWRFILLLQCHPWTYENVSFFPLSVQCSQISCSLTRLQARKSNLRQGKATLASYTRID